MTTSIYGISSRSQSEAHPIDRVYIFQSRSSSTMVGIIVNTSECHILVLLQTLPDITHRSLGSTVKGEVGSGITTPGLSFHGKDRACVLGDTRIGIYASVCFPSKIGFLPFCEFAKSGFYSVSAPEFHRSTLFG